MTTLPSPTNESISLSNLQPASLSLTQIDKVEASQMTEMILNSTAIYSWARELAKSYAPVIGVSLKQVIQERKTMVNNERRKWIKDGKQGEADWILGIGKDADVGLETYRYLYLSKNKLSGDADTDPALRHDRWEVKIQPDIAIYRSLNSK